MFAALKRFGFGNDFVQWIKAVSKKSQSCVMSNDTSHLMGISIWKGEQDNRKNDLILTMTPEKQDKTLELSKHRFADSTPARNEPIMKRTHPVKPVKCNKICSNY